MRTPNSACIVCRRPLYRRAFELAKVRYVACMQHRAQAARLAGLTEDQRRALNLGRQPGTNHRTGYKHRDESKRKSSESHKRWCAEHPAAVRARGAKLRGPLHYRWRGGAAKLNASIRRLTENRKWMDAVKARDKRCIVCQSTDKLEAHHVLPLSALVDALGITSREQARDCAALWDIENGRTLCEHCHYILHGRKHHED